MADGTLVVFTFHSVETMLAERASRSWVLDARKARRCAYLVCTRNRSAADAGAHEREAAPAEHGAAFMVARISAVERWPDSPGRQAVRFDEFALLDPPLPRVWPGHQNPVWYVADIGGLGIDPDTLRWAAAPGEPGPSEAFDAARRDSGIRLATRTTLNIDDDVLAAARSIAGERNLPVGTVLSDLARRGLRPAGAP